MKNQVVLITGALTGIGRASFITGATIAVDVAKRLCDSYASEVLENALQAA